MTVSSEGTIRLKNNAPAGSMHILLSAQGWFAAPDPDTTNGSASTTCHYSAYLQGGNLEVSNSDGSATLQKTEASDETTWIYSGSVAATSVSVKVWLGEKTSRIEDDLADSTDQLDDLEELSIDEAADVEDTEENLEPDEDTDEKVEEPTTAVPAGYLEPIAYQLDDGEAVEAGVPSQDAGSTCQRFEAEASGIEIPTESGVFTTPDQGGSSDASALRAYPATVSAVRYRTFIPKAKASTKWVCGTFKGDNRGFTNYYNARNRTRASIFFLWQQQKIETTKGIGATRCFAEYGYSAKTKRASSKGIRFQSGMIWPGYGRIEIAHAVGNPLCGVAGAIRHNVVVEAWRDGAARIAGKRGKVPNHEAYLYPKTEARGKKIFRRSSSSFICLSLNCGDESLWETT